MSLLQKLLDLSNVKNFSLSAELHSLRKQLLSLQSTYEMAVSDRDKQIADLEKKLETSTSHYYCQEVLSVIGKQNEELFAENEKLKTQLQAAKEAAIKQDDALHDKEQEVEKLLTEISEVVYAKELLKNTLTSRDTKITELKEQLQSAEDDFDEMAKLHTGLEMAFDNLADDNLALNTKLRESVSHKTEYKTLSEQYDKLHKVNESLTTKIADLQLEKSIANEKFSTEKDSLIKDLAAEIYERSLCETAIENYKATVAKQDDQLRIASNDIISLREKLRTALNENSKLKQENEALSKTLAEAISKYTTIGLEKNKLQTENVALVRRLSDSHGQPELRIRNSNLEHELTATIKDRDTYKALATHNHNSNLRLIDKIKAIHEVVKVLEPISMKFQTVLFNLLDDTNVPRT